MDWSERIGRRIRLRDLHILLAVVQCKSMAKAAEHLAISKPVISKVIADLEHVLGVRLLERDRHGAEPTIYGTALLKRGITVFDELREGVKDIEFLTDPRAGDVRIGCHPFLAASFVSTVIDRISRRYPRIVFHLAVPEAEALHHDLIERRVDLLVVQRFDLFADEQFGFETLYDDSQVIVAGVQNPWVRRRKIKLADLVNESWVLPPPESVLGSVTIAAFRARGLDCPRATVFMFPAEARMSLLATGRFLTILPASIMRFPPKRPQLRVLPIELALAPMPVGIVTVRGRTPGPVAQLFIESARDVAKPLAKRKGSMQPRIDRHGRHGDRTALRD
jgi:DNA-binding transcriptional LysR family regulator